MLGTYSWDDVVSVESIVLFRSGGGQISTADPSFRAAAPSFLRPLNLRCKKRATKSPRSPTKAMPITMDVIAAVPTLPPENNTSKTGSFLGLDSLDTTSGVPRDAGGFGF